jgi:predicted MFS family arabinose efflux permease
MLANNFITIFTYRWMGSLSDRYGERKIMIICSLLLVFIFTGYAYISFLPVLIGFYLFDNVLFGSSIALKSYLRKISTPEDLTSCLSFGMTANHITAVIIPIAGGILWSRFGHEITFIIGAVIVFIDMLFAMKIPKTTNKNN